MSITIVSDNYYFLSGMQNSKINSIYLPHSGHIDAALSSLYRKGNIVVATECIHMRKEIIKSLKKGDCNYLILLPDIVKNNHFKLGGIIFASMNLTAERLISIITTKTCKDVKPLTLRESQVLKLFHLSNSSIARILSISIKTTSGYRMSIHKKFKMKAKNNIAMLRAQKTILQCDITQLFTD